jgi:toxin ParE2
VKIRLLAPALAELDEAVNRYEAHSPSLKIQFLLEIETAKSRIVEHPNAWHPIEAGSRRFRLDRFPYGLIYAAKADEIVVIAVAHLHRKPEYWRKRLSAV